MTREESVRRASELQASGKYAESISPLAEYREQDPTDPEINHLYGVALLSSGAPSMAIWPLRAAAEHPGYEVKDGVLLAKSLLHGQIPKDAIRAASEVLRFAPDNIEALLIRTAAMHQLRDFDGTIESATSVIELNAKQMQARYWLTDSLIELERFEEAEDAYVAASELGFAMPSRDLEFVSNLCFLGVKIAHARSRLDETADRCEECLRRTGASRRAIDRAYAVMAPDRFEDLVLIIRRSIERESRGTQLRIELARVLDLNGDKAGAERVLREAVDVSPNSETLAALSDYLRSLDRDDALAEAIALQEQLLADGASFTSLGYAQLADDLIQVDRIVDAREVISQLPEHPMVKLLEGRILFLEGDPKQALDRFTEAFEKWPGNTTGRFLAGEAAIALGDIDRAISEYRNALRAGPALTDAPFRLTRIFLAQGEIHAANIALHHRLSETPKDVEALVLAARIGRLTGGSQMVDNSVNTLSEIPEARDEWLRQHALSLMTRSGAMRALEFLREQDFQIRETKDKSLVVLWTRLCGELGQTDVALGEVDLAIDADPESGLLREARALLLVNLDSEESSEVEDAYRKAVALDSNSELGWLGLGQSLLRKDKVDEGIEVLDRAASLASPYDFAKANWLVIERMLWMGGREDEVDRRLDDLLKNFPLDGRAPAMAALRLFEKSVSPADADAEKISSLVKRSSRFGPFAEVAELRGRRAAMHNEMDAAIGFFQRGLVLSPSSASIHFHLAGILAIRGELISAREHYQYAIQDRSPRYSDRASRAIQELDAQLGESGK